MSNTKAQMSNQIQSSKSKNFVIWISGLICHLDFEIWIFIAILRLNLQSYTRRFPLSQKPRPKYFPLYRLQHALR